jgi:EmrB/QacA subfamily drug resistance transporter
MSKSDEFSKRVIVILVSVVMFMEFLDTTIINTAVPSIARSFNEDPLLLKFSVTSYFLSLAIFTPISGWVADKIGTKKIFLFSVALFVVASFLCGVSSNVFELTVFRFLQGLGGAFMNPVSRIVILRIFEPKDLVRVQGAIFTPAMLGFILGPFVGGMITTYLSWSWIFYVNIPVGLCVLFFGFKFIPQQKEKHVKKFDVVGFVLSAFALGCIAFSVDMIGHTEIVPQKLTIFIGIAGVIFLSTLVAYCKNKRNPVLDFLLFQIRTFRIGFFYNIGMYMLAASFAFLLPLMYQEQFLFSPAMSGVLVLPIAFGQIIARFVAPQIINPLGFKKSMMLASSLVLFALFFIAKIQSTTPLPFIIVFEFLFGFGIVISGSSTGALNYIDIPKEKSSRATSLDLTSRQFASSLGIGVSALLLNYFRQHYGIEFSSVGAVKIFHYTFLIMASLAILAFVQAMQLGKKEGDHSFNKLPHVKPAKDCHPGEGLSSRRRPGPRLEHRTS